MPLSPGTAFQNGQYVVDALLETAPNGDLYHGTHVMSGMQVFIQVLPIAVTDGPSDLSNLTARLQGISSSAHSPLPNPLQLFQEDHTVILTTRTTIGLPWSIACQMQAPLSPKQALSTIRQIAAGTTWLQKYGIKEIDLAANRVWLTRADDGSDRICLTGLPQKYLARTQELSCPSGSTVQSLARLLHSFLTGELSPSQDAETLRRTLKERLPNLSPIVAWAIYEGLKGPQSAEKLETAQQWLALLPDDNARSKVSVNVPSPNQTASPVSPKPAPQKPAKRHLYPALGVTALMAAIAGVTLGTVWRLNANSLPGIIQLDPEQSFPAQADWSGDAPEVSFEEPFVPQQDEPTRRDDWSDSDWETTPREDVWEPPTEVYEEYPEPSEFSEETWEEFDESTVNPSDFAEEELEPEPYFEEADEAGATLDGSLKAPPQLPLQNYPDSFDNAEPAVQTPTEPKSKSAPMTDASSKS
jgi:hypothetical protein